LRPAAAARHPAAAALVLLHPAVSLKLVPAAALHLQLLLLGLGSSNALVAGAGAAEGCSLNYGELLYS
jgi:hypothetical protein